MAPFMRGGGRHRSSRGRSNRAGRSAAPRRSDFKTSRLQEEEDVADQSGSEIEAAASEDDIEDSPEDSSSTSEDEEVPANSYSNLLQALRPKSSDSAPVRKKRKLNGDLKSTTNGLKDAAVDAAPAQLEGAAQEEGPGADLLEPAEDPIEAGEEEAAVELESEDEEQMLHDPFENQYSTIAEEDVTNFVQAVQDRKALPQTTTIDGDIRRTFLPTQEEAAAPKPFKKLSDLHLKQRLKEGGAKVTSTLSETEKDLAGSIFAYNDVLHGCRTIANATRLREICALHALNHVFKTRDRVLKNNAKLSQPENADNLDCRDQGFTRPKVLVIVPTKQACVRFVESIVKLSEPDQQENKSRFLDTYSREDEDDWENKPEDFQELFGGNHEEDFRVGLKFTRKTIKFFSGFYNSDIILGSPLGLMRTITTGGGAKDKKKGHDADFLSSIEVLIVDHASALQMQNWQHVEYVFSQLNLLPKDSHGCDFSRVRSWYLDGNAKYLRQTIILSSYLTPEINALASTNLHNIAGRVKHVPTYRGAMLDVSSSLPITVNQTFTRFDSPSPLTDNDARFKYFTATILPPLLRDKHSQKGVLIFVPTYLDFVRLRNHLSTSTETVSLSFGSISEYTEVKDVARARSHFLSGRHSVLLYSERAHHHFRHRIKGVRKLIFYGVPENPIFWTEMVSLLGMNPDVVQGSAGKGRGRGLVRAMFSKWDVMKLERIVGTERVRRLVSEKGGDTFDFV